MYLFFAISYFSSSQDIFIESEKITQISGENSDICFFAIKDTHWSLPPIYISNKSSASMEKFLNILESPQPQQQQQDNFNEEKVRYTSSKISIWNFFEIPEATYRNFSVPEKSKMFREYYARLCDKYYGSTGKKIIFFLVWPDCFYVCFFWCVFGLGPIFIFFCLFFGLLF